MKLEPKNIHTTERLATITPEEGVILYDKSKGVLVAGDGTTKGGRPMGGTSGNNIFDGSQTITGDLTVLGNISNGHPTFKSCSFVSRAGTYGTTYLGGFYEAPATDANLTNASATQTLGDANAPYGAHAFLVAGAAGTTDSTTLTVTVTGTSVTDAGVRTATDSEVIVADCTAATTDQYFETTKKWVGQVTYTLASEGGTTFAFDFNYGFCKYEDFGNRDFTVTDFEVVGLANANDTGFNIELIKHTETGWTYHATAFVPGPTAEFDLQTVYDTEYALVAGEHFAFKISGLTIDVEGSGSEGVVCRVTTTANAAVARMDTHVGAIF